MIVWWIPKALACFQVWRLHEGKSMHTKPWSQSMSLQAMTALSAYLWHSAELKIIGTSHWGCVSKFVSHFLRRINEVDIRYSTISWWFISQLYIYYVIKYYKPGIICGISRPLSYKTMVVTPIQAVPLSGPEPLWELGLADNFITDKGLEELLRPGEWTWWADHETYHLVMTNSSPWYRWNRWPIEIDGLPIKHGGSFHGYVK